MIHLKIFVSSKAEKKRHKTHRAHNNTEQQQKQKWIIVIIIMAHIFSPVRCFWSLTLFGVSVWVCEYKCVYMCVCVLIIIMLIIARIANASLLHCVAIITNFQDGYFSWLYTLIPVWHTIFAAFVRSLDANELPIPFTSVHKTTATIIYIHTRSQN